MSVKHTLGPWTLTTVPTSVGSCHKIGPFPVSSSIRSEIYACVYVDGAYIGREESPATQELHANARLIAAAPELLAALQAFVALDTSFSTICNQHLNDMVDEGQPLARAVKQARAAIAKATGEPS
jgi:hypothetical protein